MTIAWIREELSGHRSNIIIIIMVVSDGCLLTKRCFSFFHVQEDMNLSENLREPIRNRDMATKVDMLCSFKRRQLASQVNQCYKQETINVYISE